MTQIIASASGLRRGLGDVEGTGCRCGTAGFSCGMGSGRCSTGDGSAMIISPSRSPAVSQEWIVDSFVVRFQMQFPLVS